MEFDVDWDQNISVWAETDIQQEPVAEKDDVDSTTTDEQESDSNGPNEEEVEMAQPRRSTRQRRRPDFYGTVVSFQVLTQPHSKSNSFQGKDALSQKGE